LSILCLWFSSSSPAVELGFEAEDADPIIPEMAIFEDQNASGGKYIAAGLGNGGRHPGQAEYSIDIFVAGEYSIWGRVLTTDGSNDSFHVTIDDDKSPQAADADKIWDTGQPFLEWTWSKITWREQNPLSFQLEKGSHKVIVWAREGNTRRDAIYISTHPNATPKLPEEIEDPGEAVEANGKLTTLWGHIRAR
jgi:hypothetical protein